MLKHMTVIFPLSRDDFPFFAICKECHSSHVTFYFTDRGWELTCNNCVKNVFLRTLETKHEIRKEETR